MLEFILMVCIYLHGPLTIGLSIQAIGEESSHRQIQDFHLGEADNGQLKMSKSTSTTNKLHLLYGLKT